MKHIEATGYRNGGPSGPEPHGGVAIDAAAATPRAGEVGGAAPQAAPARHERHPEQHPKSGASAVGRTAVFLVRVAQGLLLPAVLLAVWQIAVDTGALPETLIASPVAVARSFAEMVRGRELFEHCGVSLQRLALGFGLGTALGVTLGTLVGASRLVARVVEPTVLSLIPIPPIAWIPLLIILFGIGESSKVLLISIGSFCTLFIQAAYGVRSTDRNLVELATVFRKSRWKMLRQILLPSAVPGILSSMRVALALSWTLLICGEMIASSRGLGWLIWDSRNFSRAADMIVGMAVVGVLGKLTDSLLVALERWMTRWRATYQDAANV